MDLQKWLERDAGAEREALISTVGEGGVDPAVSR